MVKKTVIGVFFTRAKTYFFKSLNKEIRKNTKDKRREEALFGKKVFKETRKS